MHPSHGKKLTNFGRDLARSHKIPVLTEKFHLRVITIVASLALAPLALASGVSTDNCTVRFIDLPGKTDGSELSSVGLEDPKKESISLVSPREAGLFLVGADGPSDEPVYISYRLPEGPQTEDYFLDFGLRGLEWATAAVPTDEFVTTVAPGRYRIVLVYVVSASQGSAEVCLTMSPVFDLTEPVALHRFESD